MPFFLVAFSHATQYRRDYLARDREYVRNPQTCLREICARRNVLFLDLYPSLSEEDFKQDGIHLTANGRRHAAEAVAKFVTTNKLVPPGSN